MFEQFKQRSYRLEYIDTGNYTPEEYEDCIGEFSSSIAGWATRIVLRARSFGKCEAVAENFSMLDVGAGSGELLRVTAAWARETSAVCAGSGSS